MQGQKMSKDLTVIEQREVTFYDDELTAVRANDGQIYVSVRHMCNGLGLDDRSQRRRMKRHTVLKKGFSSGVIMTPEGVRRTSSLLRVDLVPLWLTTIDIRRTKEEIQPKLEKYQEEVAKVLWEAFQDGRLTTDPDFDMLLQTDSDAVQAYKMLQAMVKLARNQVILESRLDAHEQRLEAIETELGSGRTITPDQTTAISQAVKAVALVMSKRTNRNEYGGVYSELYRRYRIPSYRELPAAKYDDAIKWLGEWLESLTGDEAFNNERPFTLKFI